MRPIDADLLKAVLVMSDKTGKMNCGDMRKVLELVDDVPTADVRENVKAYWKNVNDEYYRCSYCGGCADIAYHYCPWCGADMRGEA